MTDKINSKNAGQKQKERWGLILLQKQNQLISPIR